MRPDMEEQITFGTDGWRAVIADGFTFDNVRRVSSAIAVAARTLEPPADIDRNALVVGFDRRFLSREFAAVVAETLRSAGFRVILSSAPTPSQTISFTAWRRKLLGGVVVTASHNPAKYNGLKFKAWYGGSALPEVYAAIAGALGSASPADGGSIEESDLLDDYVAALRAQLDLVKTRRVRILHDPIHGVASGLPSRILGGDIATIRGEINPSFGGVNPEPIAENLRASAAAMDGAFDLAVCNDGDADRLGILDEYGEFVSPQKIIALLALYLVREKGMKGEIVKTFSTSRLVEKVARALGAGFHETAIGFKYVADLMMDHDILIGGEESGGIGYSRFLPERDGVLNCLLLANVMAEEGKPLGQLVADLQREFGPHYYGRRDLHIPEDVKQNAIQRARADGAQSLGKYRVLKKENMDGVKFFLDAPTNGNGAEAWVLFRASGTEPLLRLYTEASSPELVSELLVTGESFVRNSGQ